MIEQFDEAVSLLGCEPTLARLLPIPRAEQTVPMTKVK
jgi:hypothetical protein